MGTTANRRAWGQRSRTKQEGTKAGTRGSAERAAARAASEPRVSLYDEVTSRIIAELEGGRVPWAQPWSKAAAGGAAPGLPRNALTGRAYSGINVLILWGALWARATPEGGPAAYSSHGWLTFRQAIEAGGCVRKGERGTTVVYADRFTPEAERARAAESGEGEGDKSSLRGSDGRPNRSIAFLKRFTVFNIDQCDGLPDHLVASPPPLPEREIVPAAEALIVASGADFRIGGDKAFYAPGPDFVAVPPQPAFHDQINYYRTALHELTHWTGHASRLARDFSGSFGTDAYAREELVAEMGAAFLCASLGIVPTVRHSDYLASWLTVLRGDNRAIFRAASAATKAADFLLAFQTGGRDRADGGAAAQPAGASPASGDA
jgi:antirestriction protein ArdC